MSDQATESEAPTQGWAHRINLAAIRLFYTLAALPLVWIILFYSFAIRARFKLGVWPSYEEGPDAGSLGFQLHHQSVGWTLILLPLSFVVWGFLTTPPSVPSRRFGALLGLWALPILAAITDPGNLIRWFFLYSD